MIGSSCVLFALYVCCMVRMFAVHSRVSIFFDPSSFLSAVLYYRRSSSLSLFEKRQEKRSTVATVTWMHKKREGGRINGFAFSFSFCPFSYSLYFCCWVCLHAYAASAPFYIVFLFFFVLLPFFFFSPLFSLTADSSLHPSKATPPSPSFIRSIFDSFQSSPVESNLPTPTTPTHDHGT